MNVGTLFAILGATTREFRKGEPVTERDAGGVTVVDVYMMPHVDEAPPNLELVDVVFETIGVDKTKAEQHKETLIALLKEYPEPERLAAGPSYIEVGAVLGSQDAALRLFALGSVLGFWNVFVPGGRTIPQEKRLEMAGHGFMFISGWSAPDEAG